MHRGAPAICGEVLAHADDQNLDAALKRLGEDGRLEARGVPITQALLGRLLAAAPRTPRLPQLCRGLPPVPDGRTVLPGPPATTDCQSLVAGGIRDLPYQLSPG